MTELRLPIATGAVFKGTLLTGTIVAPSSKDVGGSVADAGLRKPGDEAVGSSVVALHGLFEEICCNPLIVTGNMGVVSEHGGPVDRKPSQNADVLVVGFALEA